MAIIKWINLSLMGRLLAEMPCYIRIIYLNIFHVKLEIFLRVAGVAEIDETRGIFSSFLLLLGEWWANNCAAGECTESLLIYD